MYYVVHFSIFFVNIGFKVNQQKYKALIIISRIALVL
jgi:hypothetical protein